MIGVRKMQEITLKRKIYTELQKWKKEYAPEYALFIPGIDEYRYVPITNVILSKAEIPFLIFERNKGNCFIQKC